ncbi:zinc finger BED domain-containing protein RICESLEEPER 2-like [Rhizophagus irregularis DAOM 181602=DAOM 197198]|nr:zinc finger BED domain-containing protein RICESLEEPER 2-like [Rhizophagus irregularis DAOM 181602=DAOM 197198]
MSENLALDLEQPNDLGNERENERNIEEQQNESDNEEEKDVDEKSSSSKHSWVWNHFTYDNTVKKARCNHCKTLISNNKGSTSGMSSHVRSKHRLLIDENDNSNKNKKQITLQESFQNSAEIMLYNEDNFRKLLIRYVVMGDHSFLSIESKDFHNLIHLLRKDASIPSADIIKKEIINTFNNGIKEIRKVLQEVSGKISFTIDAWTSSNSISFLGITAHWISDEWELKNILLDFVKLEGSHSGKNIKEFFLKSLKDFGIMTKILGITTDNASNNNTFLEEVSNELAEKNIEFDNVNQHVRCLAHIINLAAQEALKSLKATVNTSEDELLNQHENIQNNNNQVGVVGSILCKLRTLICKIRASPQQREKFSAQCKVADIPDKMVILDVRTRWNSTFDMLVRARELKEPLNTLSNSDINLRSFTLNEKEWECLAEIELMLKGFSKATKQICAETYPTIAYVIPYYNILLSRLEDFRDSPGRCKEGKEAASNAIRKLLEYYDKTDTSIYTISLVLDPRLKIQYMKDQKWDKRWIESARKKVLEIYKGKYAPIEINNINNEYDSSDEDLITHISKRRRVEKSNEFETFIKGDRAPALSDTLNWWKRHKEEFPNLANMAKDYLGIPATSVPSERVFSSAADVVTSDRARLAPETIRAIMCLKHWYRSGILE